jgi:hypothetical protein
MTVEAVKQIAVLTQHPVMRLVHKELTLEEQKEEELSRLLKCEGIGVSADHAEALRGAKGS